MRAGLSAEFDRAEPELQAALVETIGHGPPRGLFFLLDRLSGPYAELAAIGIAKMCQAFTPDVALTEAELALVKRYVPAFPEPRLLDA